MNGRLDEIEARVAAVEPAPWTVKRGEHGAVWVDTPTYPHTLALHGFPDEAEFIAHARQDVPALVAALRAVLDLHRLDVRDGECWNCHGHQHPCPTVRVITSALDAS